MFRPPGRGKRRISRSGATSFSHKGKGMFRPAGRPSLPTAAKKAKRRLNRFGSRLPLCGNAVGNLGLDTPNGCVFPSTIGLLLVPLPLVRCGLKADAQTCQNCFWPNRSRGFFGRFVLGTPASARSAAADSEAESIRQCFSRSTPKHQMPGQLCTDNWRGPRGEGPRAAFWLLCRWGQSNSHRGAKDSYRKFT